MRKKIYHLFRQFKNSELFRNTSILVSGTALAQLIPILLQPLLRRFYPPEAYGTFLVYTSIIGILVIGMSLKYDNAIVLPKKDKTANNLLLLSVFNCLAISVALFIVILIWKNQIIALLNIHLEYQQFIYLVPVGALLYSVYQAINFWLIRKKAFIEQTYNKLTRRGFEGISQIGFHYIPLKLGLIWGDIIGNTANCSWGIRQSMKKGLKFRDFSLVKLKYGAKRYIDFPKYNVLPGLMSACSYLLPAILINKYYSADNTGYFDLSRLLLSVPLALISSSLSNVLLQRIAEKKNLKISIKKDLISILVTVTIISGFEILIISFWAEKLFSIFFGQKWIFSGSISKILVWSYALNFIISSFTSLFISLSKIKVYSIWQVFYFLLIISLLLFSSLPFIEFLKVYVLIEIVCYISLIFLIFAIVYKYEISIK